jgi:hypothetical protein
MIHFLLSDLRPLASGLFAAPLLLAALLDDLLKLIVPSVFVVFWVLSQIAEAKKKAKAPRPVQPPQQPAGQGDAAQGRAAADPLREQVDAFLRRAGGQAPVAPAGGGAAGPAMQKPRPPATPNRDSIEILLGNEPVAANRPPLSEPLREMASTRSTPSSPVPAPPRRQRTPRPPQRGIAPQQQSVADHVAEHVTSAVRQISEEAAHLGDRVAESDRQFNTQLQQKFDHEIGTLGDRHALRVQDQQPAAAPVNPAVQIATLLASPDGMRQAMILNEVLRRPEERW